MTREKWLGLIADWCGAGALPGRADVGVHYPWRTVGLHAASREHRQRVRAAERAVRAALAADVDWRVSISGGKDSTALVVLLAECGWRVPAVSVKDDLDFPGERSYVEALCRMLALPADILTPPSLRAHLVRNAVSLVQAQHGRAHALSAKHFYGLLDAHRAQHGYDGVIMGLRAGESAGRAANYAARGSRYRRAYDGLTVAQPIAQWSALDVHAYLWSHGVPLLPCYHSIDRDADAMSMRKSWWIVGGLPATIGGHYAWLRRWWPTLYEVAADIDPGVRAVS